MAEPTKGPWVVEAIDSGYPHEICLGYDVPGEGSPILLATVFYDEERDGFISPAQANANARLIAAAPDLLAACRMALTYIEHCVEPSCNEGEELEDGSIYDGSTEEGNALRAAIAKAEGSK